MDSDIMISGALIITMEKKQEVSVGRGTDGVGCSLSPVHPLAPPCLELSETGIQILSESGKCGNERHGVSWFSGAAYNVAYIWFEECRVKHK